MPSSESIVDEEMVKEMYNQVGCSELCSVVWFFYTVLQVVANA